MGMQSSPADGYLSAVPDPAPSPNPAPYGLQLVVGHDGHPASDSALNVAVELAERLGAHLHVVHSVTTDDSGIDPDIEEWEQAKDRNIRNERKRITDALAGLPVRWTYHEERGEPARRLAHLATEVDAQFIVVGATHRGLLHHLASGSVSGRLLHTQGRPVLVVPEARRG
jgi:nucleotide-binding universal stress UspA family protein